MISNFGLSLGLQVFVTEKFNISNINSKTFLAAWVMYNTWLKSKGENSGILMIGDTKVFSLHQVACKAEFYYDSTTGLCLHV